jgi:inosine-uridine nucleoside N-ribohydrolase
MPEDTVFIIAQNEESSWLAQVQPESFLPLLMTQRFFVHCMALIVILFGSSLTVLAGKHEGKPVILDTDIGTDIDDTWALVYLLKSPELQLKLVVTDTGDAHYRAKIVAKMLQNADRTDVAVGVGIAGSMPDSEKNLAPWVQHYDLSHYPGRVIEDGVGALIEVVMNSPEPVTIIAIGAVPNLAEALKREPRIAAKCRLIGMQGSFDLGYDGHAPAAAEANVRVNPAALRTVLSAPWIDVLLAPLDTCGTVSLKGTNYSSVWGAVDDPLLRSIVESYCIFAPRVAWMNCDYFTTRSTTLFDCVAVYLATSESLVNIETVTFKITDDGFTRRDPQGVRARVALSWKDENAFETLLTRRLNGHLRWVFGREGFHKI